MEIACPKCRHLNPPEAKFCLQCGAQVNETSQNRSSDPLVGKQVGNLRLVKRIGAGGMGVVYLAEHINLGKPYAIKFLHPQFAADEEVVERFRREARVIASLDHENIIRETDFGWLEGFGFYLVMEYLEGKTLKKVIRGGEALPPTRILNIFEQLCGALEEAHEKDIVHRDLKPENLFLVHRRGREMLKILDFGIARIAQTGIPSEFTVDGEVYGSPTYMSPEQARGDLQQITPRSDLYSVGVILFEALSGRTPFQGKTPTEVMLGHITHTPPRLSEIRPDLPPNPVLENLLIKALAKDPSERFASAWELYEALRQAMRVGNELEATYDEHVSEDSTTLDMNHASAMARSDSSLHGRSLHRGQEGHGHSGSFAGSKNIAQVGSELAEDSRVPNKPTHQSWPPQSAPSSSSYPNIQGNLPPLRALESSPQAMPAAPSSQSIERSLAGVQPPSLIVPSAESSLAGVPAPQALAPSSSPSAPQLPFPGFSSPHPQGTPPKLSPPSSTNVPSPLNRSLSSTDASTAVVFVPEAKAPEEEEEVDITPRKNPKAPQVVLSHFDDSVQHDEATRAVDLASILPPGSKALLPNAPLLPSTPLSGASMATATEMIAPMRAAENKSKPPDYEIEEEPTSLDQQFARDLALQMHARKKNESASVEEVFASTMQQQLPSKKAPPKASSSKSPLLMLVGFLSVLLVAGGIWFFTMRDNKAIEPINTPDQLPPVPSTPRPKPEFRTMRVVIPGPGGSRPVYTFPLHLLTFPPNAEVLIQGRGKVARTPCILDIAANATVHIRFRKEGYHHRDFTWKLVGPLEKGVKLEKK